MAFIKSFEGSSMTLGYFDKSELNKSTEELFVIILAMELKSLPKDTNGSKSDCELVGMLNSLSRTVGINEDTASHSRRE